MEQARILIVDDDPDITEAMRIVLEDKGYVQRAGWPRRNRADKADQAGPDNS